MPCWLQVPYPKFKAELDPPVLILPKSHKTSSPSSSWFAPQRDICCSGAVAFSGGDKPRTHHQLCETGSNSWARVGGGAETSKAAKPPFLTFPRRTQPVFLPGDGAWRRFDVTPAPGALLGNLQRQRFHPSENTTGKGSGWQFQSLSLRSGRAEDGCEDI